MSMKVLYVNHTATISGAERALLGLFEHLPADVEPILSCPDGPLAVEAAIIGVPLSPLQGTDVSFRLHPLRTARGAIELASSAVRAARIAGEAGAQVIHANSVRAGLMCLAVPGRRIVHVHDALPSGPVAGLVRRAVCRADLVIANSRYTAERLVSARSRARLEVIPNGIDFDRFQPDRIQRSEARLRLGFDDRTLLVGVVGQITPWKGLEDAIRATSLLATRFPSLRLLIVGSVKFGSSSRYHNRAYLSSLRRLVADRSLDDRVQFLGEREDIPEIMRALDLLLVPSWEEPFGRVVIEAMAMRTPVLATSVGGPAEVISDGIDGALLQPRDAPGWSEAMAGILADPARRRRMGRMARLKVERQFGMTQIAARTVEFYRQLIGS
jgi:L-malate glycosyltransferase